MFHSTKWLFLVTGVSLIALRSAHEREQRVFKDDEGPRQGRDLLDWIGLGTGPDVDPYLAKANAECLNGDLAECFKSRALQSLDDFFDKPVYYLTENARITRMPESQLRSVAREPYEFSEAPRSDEPEWDQLVKFVLRKVERFMKSSAIEVKFNDEVTERGRYSPRFIDEIADEIDVIEDKKDSYFKRKQLKKLFIPMLIILKLFKLKLLLFLPLILGLASFKKLLGFLAIVIPGLIGFFKLCKPHLQSSFSQSGFAPHYSSGGIGFQPHYRDPQPTFLTDEHSYYNHDKGLAFKEDPQELAYSGYSHYRNSGGDVAAIGNENTSKKSILPDS
ncbi:uncharacterized protein LOC108742907 [Agrilus planipennis]|uniref:Uncharacterized protein LOC108742907 n=1 Tax=Agrilus planipennis TaxID=224129 RepID=A0A1W4XCN4_AGRPL|nr:uncharacterized protein LOC108742907 [Agrilus planipennis]